jgi:hypothetical protein
MHELCRSTTLINQTKAPGLSSQHRAPNEPPPQLPHEPTARIHHQRTEHLSLRGQSFLRLRKNETSLLSWTSAMHRHAFPHLQSRAWCGWEKVVTGEGVGVGVGVGVCSCCPRRRRGGFRWSLGCVVWDVVMPR